ncbi:hypothetical protein EYF80_036898 [Liparis tanakae]|uniref:Uncharacterized protein n=1 Tax=Liparis tanakae TaxID=230148 RepID=A0A4Z2GI65_9TELE|nr:hypothetical protein EYF80_036898 [Liparis tanakae]
METQDNLEEDKKGNLSRQGLTREWATDALSRVCRQSTTDSTSLKDTRGERDRPLWSTVVSCALRKDEMQVALSAGWQVYSRGGGCRDIGVFAV